MAAKRKQFRKNEKTRADVADSLFKTLSQKMKIAQEKGNKSEIVVLKRQLKKALISTPVQKDSYTKLWGYDVNILSAS